MYPTDRLKKNLLLSLFVTIAVGLNMAENFIPVTGMLPGVKIGISNIVTLTVIYMFSLKEGIIVSVLKSFVLLLISGSVTSFFYSISGGVLSSLAMGIFKNEKYFSHIGISLIGSFTHITTQIILASLLLNSKTVFYYYPFMLFISIITGIITGFTVKIILNKIKVGRRN